MKISASAVELANALALAAALSDDRTAKKIPALAAVHLAAAGDIITITTNVLDFALTLTVPATIEAPGELAVSAARLAALVAGFPHEASVEIVTDGAVARVDYGRSHFRLATVPIEDVPPMLELVEEIGRLTLAREEAQLLFTRPMFAVCTEQTRYYLCGIYLSSATVGLLQAVGTDGYRLCRVSIVSDAALTPQAERGPTVPTAAVEIISKILRDKDVEIVTLRRSRTLLAVETATATFITKLNSGTFPAYERFVPGPSGNHVTADRASLMQALERAVAVLESRGAVVGLRWGAELALRLCNPGSDAIDDVIAAETAGNGAVAVQAHHLAELLDVLDGKRVRFDSGGGQEPILVTDPDDEDAPLIVQMPCRWQASRAVA
jgi:DNA polymerase III subunit beta